MAMIPPEYNFENYKNIDFQRILDKFNIEKQSNDYIHQESNGFRGLLYGKEFKLIYYDQERKWEFFYDKRRSMVESYFFVVTKFRFIDY